MATKMKGIYKSFKFISQIFAIIHCFFYHSVVVKEREMEIGYPTDVKHVAHIGWDGLGSAPSWMNEFKSVPEFSTAVGTIADTGDSNSIPCSTWSSQDFEQLMAQQPASEIFKEQQLPPDLPNLKKKTRKKSKSRLSKERLHF